MLDTSIFKTYDIRGIFPDQINDEAAYLIGRAFVTLLNAKTVVVGRDMRESGAGLFEALSKGITDQGADVEDIGMCSTPMVSFACARWGHDGGIMISASHNPSEYNAFKLVKKPSEQLSAETGIEEIKRLCLDARFERRPKGAVIPRNVLEDYMLHVLSFGRYIKGLKAVVDYGNGMGGLATKPVLEELGIRTVHMYIEPDGRFPNHPANPHDIENLGGLQERVVQEKADLGIFYDGDADRSVLVDHTGAIVHADILTGLLATEELKRHPGETVYYDLRFSRAVKEAILAAGGKPVMMKVGNPFYKSALLHKGGVLAGEFSGHIMFRDNFAIDDGLFAAVKAMDIMCRSGRRLAELVKPFQKYATSDEISRKVKDARATLEKAKEHYKDGRFSGLDGILIEYPEWWFSLRMSNTEPLVRLRLEARTKELLEKKQAELLRLLQ